MKSDALKESRTSCRKRVQMAKDVQSRSECHEARRRSRGVDGTSIAADGSTSCVKLLTVHPCLTQKRHHRETVVIVNVKQ